MASGKRTKKKLSNRVAYKKERSLRGRKIKAKKAAAKKRGLNRNRKRRTARGSRAKK